MIPSVPVCALAPPGAARMVARTTAAMALTTAEPISSNRMKRLIEGPPFHHGRHAVRDGAREGSPLARRDWMPATPRARLRGEGALASLPRGPQHPPNKIILGLPAPPIRDRSPSGTGTGVPSTLQLLSTAGPPTGSRHLPRAIPPGSPAPQQATPR